VRIISGEKRGLQLVSPHGKDVRPTHDKVREALFGRLQFSVPDTAFLDLFAGSGAVGIEALSRGAKHAVFCDKSDASLYVVRENIKKAGYMDKSTVVRGDYLRIIESFKNKYKFDIVFIDPPYASDYYLPALTALAENKVLNDGAIVVLESDNELDFEIASFEIQKSKKYGKCYLSYLEYKDE